MKTKMLLRRELYRLPDKSKGGLPIIPVDERGAEIRVIKVGRRDTEAEYKGGGRTTKQVRTFSKWQRFKNSWSLVDVLTDYQESNN
jgi:hypothetical protein